MKSCHTLLYYHNLQHHFDARRLDMLGSVSLVPLVIGITAQNLVIARTGRAAKTVTRFSKTLQASHIQQQIVHHIPVLRVFKVITAIAELFLYHSYAIMREVPFSM